MRAVSNIVLYEQDVKFFGEGPYKLLRCVEETHSLNAAASRMYMSYSKAFMIIKRAEGALGFALTEKKIGGAGGGGSFLTPEALEFLDLYEQYTRTCCEANEKLFNEMFSHYK